MNPNVDEVVAAMCADEREYLLEFTRSSKYVHPFYTRRHVPHMWAKLKGYVEENHVHAFKIELKLTSAGRRVRRAIVQLRRADLALSGVTE